MLLLSWRATLSLATRVICTLSILLGGMACSNAQDQFQRPNILFILADDLGVNDIGSWGDGKAPTPTLDQLSRQAIRFRQNYADSTCSVSRASLLTGRLPVSIGFEPDGLGLSPDLETLPKSLHVLGYATHHLGKWHVGEGLEYPQIQPGHQGFDDWFGMMNHFVLQGPGPNGEIIRRRPTYFDPWLQENGGPPKQYKGHLDDLLTERALSLIEHPVAGKPWFINLWYLAPHEPVQPSTAFAKKFPDTAQGRYLAMLSQLDHNVGRLLQALDATGQAERTIVVFASDNGSPDTRRNSNFPLTGTKATYLEGGVRTPLLIRWPGHSGNRDLLEASHEMDLFPTLVAMAGGKPPPDLDGRNLLPWLLGGKPPKPPELYWAADNLKSGMTYSGHLPGKGLFYRDIFGGLQSAAVTGPLLPDVPRATDHHIYDRQEASRLIHDWELRHRPLPLQWHARTASTTAYLSGRDLQRAPVFGGYALGMGLGRTAFGEPQILLQQPGVWSIGLDAGGHIQVTYVDRILTGDKLTLDRRCNALVATSYIKPASSFPFPGPAVSRLMVYLNGQLVLNSDQMLQRPANAAPLAAPTYIGAAVDGRQPYAGTLGRPQVVGKFLAPVQDGYSLVDLSQEVCR